MTARRKIRGKEAHLGFEALSIEGGLLSPEWLSKIAQLAAGQQSDADYRIPKGLQLRDEIGRYWRIAQALWKDFQHAREATATGPELPLGGKSPLPRNGGEGALLPATHRFLPTLLREVFGFISLRETPPLSLAKRSYPIGHAALGARVPVVIVPPLPGKSSLDAPRPELGDDSRRRSAFGLAQEYLNAAEGSLWGIASDGLRLRILRDNASLTRPAWIEADLQRIFTEERYADFAALWLLLHESRFGREGQPVGDCPLETWREAGKNEGIRARTHLRNSVRDALLALGEGFLAHPENQALREALHTGALSPDAYFNQLLRLVYRLIFLLTVEERDLLHPPGTSEATRSLYAKGYGLRRLRERAVRRSAHDRHADLWEGTRIVFRGLALGEPRLGLPALAGLFAREQAPDLDASRLPNHAYLLALFHLAWIKQDGALARVNWRDMGPEELGSVYESLLELVPRVDLERRKFAFAEAEESKGNARKTSGSYYTPESLVQALLDSALEPVIEETIARNPERPAEALLELTIVDPACGSGHFLLAAARRLANHVARLEADATPSAAEYRHALRRVVSRCIYGVDLNPMAVELCKVALWMEAVEPGLPLGFLDSHIQAGNALLGTTPELMEKGIPDEAWNPIGEDDRVVARELKKRNKQEAVGQQTLDLWATTANPHAEALRQAIATLEAKRDDDPQALKEKEADWSEILRSEAYLHEKRVADAWCAAFAWPKQQGEAADAAPTNEAWRRLKGDQKPHPFLLETVEALARQYRFFHWHLQFPQIFSRGGFDVVLGNPPWERVKIQEQEFFASRDEEIARAPNAAARKKFIASLEKTNSPLWEEWSRASRQATAESHFICRSGRYPLCGKGDVNTYAIFAEHNRNVLGSRGRCGFIVPTGIATDDTTKDFFSDLVDSASLVSLYSFENRERLFPSVDSRFSFALVSLAPEGNAPSARLLFYARSPAEISDPDRVFTLQPEDFRLLNPNTRTCPVFRSRRELEVNRSIYRRVPLLLLTGPTSEDDQSPWEAQLSTLLHMSKDANLLSTRKQLEIDGWTRTSRTFNKNGSRMLPLYEGRLAHQFNHRFAQEPDGLLVSTSDQQLADPSFSVEPHYWIPESAADKMLARRNHGCKKGLLGFRRVARNTDERTVIASLLPWGPASYGFIITSGPDAVGLLALSAIYNSFPVDFVCRTSLTQASIPQSIFQQLPILSPAQLATIISGTGKTGLDFIIQRTIELIYTAWDLEPFAHDLLTSTEPNPDEFGFSAYHRRYAASAAVGETGSIPPFRWDPERRFLLRCELDAAFFHLYGLSRDDTAYVMDTFPIVRRNDERDHGEYRTKRVILEIYDALSEAARTGKPYQTRLDPPPADPRQTHPPLLPKRDSSEQVG